MKLNPFYKASDSAQKSRSADVRRRVVVFLSLILFSLLTVFPCHSSAESLDNWQTINPTTSTYAVNACAYGAGKFVAVADHAKILISSDDKTWTIKNSLQTLRAIAYGNDTFVAVGDNGAVLISDNGIDWKTRDSGSSQMLHGITFGKGKFVAVGDNGTILTSPYGTVWTTISSGSVETFRAIAVWEGENSKFVAVGDNGAVLTSYNATSWVTEISGSSQALRAIAFGNDNIIVVGDKGAIISYDGREWEKKSSGTAEALYGIAFGNDYFVAVGNNGAILTSSDGSAWTSRSPVIASALYGAAFWDDRFVAVGDNGAIIQSDKTVPPAPNITLSPNSHDFGKVATGNESEFKVFTISNTGNADLSVKRIAVRSTYLSEFNLYSESFNTTIEPSFNCTFEINFMPMDKGLRRANISVTSDDPDQPELLIPIKGTGVPPPSIKASVGIGGSITPSGNVKVQKDADQTFTIAPDEGYELVDVKVDGVSKGAVTSYEFTGVTANHKIAASFRIKTYNITATSGPNGRITPSGTVKVKHGKARTFFIKPSKGFKIAEVLVDGKSVGTVSNYPFTAVTGNHTIEATFTPTTSDSAPNAD